MTGFAKWKVSAPLLRLERSRNGKFATLNVGETKQHVSNGASEAGLFVRLGIAKAPLDATNDFPSDPSHAEVNGLPRADSDAAMPYRRFDFRVCPNTSFPWKKLVEFDFVAGVFDWAKGI